MEYHEFEHVKIVNFFYRSHQAFTIARQNYRKKNKLGFFSEIRDFGIFSHFSTRTNLSGIVVKNFNFFGFNGFFASNLEYTSQKNWGF